MAYRRIDEYDEITTGEIAAHVKEILSLLGEDPEREGLKDTPARVAKSLQFLTKGMCEDPKQIVGSAIFKGESDDMVVVKDIEFFSTCEHHLLPFFGKCHVAYIPRDMYPKIIGLSKVARIVEACARKLQVQERLTVEIARTLSSLIPNSGVAVVVEAQHTCMQARGVEKFGSLTITRHFSGSFTDDDLGYRTEFLKSVGL